MEGHTAQVTVPELSGSDWHCVQLQYFEPDEAPGVNIKLNFVSTSFTTVELVRVRFGRKSV